MISVYRVAGEGPVPTAPTPTPRPASEPSDDDDDDDGVDDDDDDGVVPEGARRCDRSSTGAGRLLAQAASARRRTRARAALPR